MDRRSAYDGDVKYKRVNKTLARKAYEAGQPVVLCPVKLAPFGGFRPSCMVDKAGMQERDFNTVALDFIWYNCQLNETGYYPSYWIQS